MWIIKTDTAKADKYIKLFWKRNYILYCTNGFV